MLKLRDIYLYLTLWLLCPEYPAQTEISSLLGCDCGLKAGQAVYVYKWIAQCGSNVLDRIVISEIVVCNIPLPNIQIWRKPFITGRNDFRRDPWSRMSQIRLKLASTANAPHSLCTCGSQIMQFDCMIIQSAESECCHSVWLCYMRGLSPDQT